MEPGRECIHSRNGLRFNLRIHMFPAGTDGEDQRLKEKFTQKGKSGHYLLNLLPKKELSEVSIKHFLKLYIKTALSHSPTQLKNMGTWNLKKASRILGNLDYTGQAVRNLSMLLSCFLHLKTSSAFLQLLRSMLRHCFSAKITKLHQTFRRHCCKQTMSEFSVLGEVFL